MLACAKPSASASASRETPAWTSSTTASGASRTTRPTSRNRFTGFEGEPTPTDVGRDILDFSEYAPYRRTGLQLLLRPKCNGPIAWKYFDAVRRENVVAGVDCGCATFAGAPTVLPTIAWAKVGALAEGARIASKKLWARPT
jgi:hypothetical protein